MEIKYVMKLKNGRKIEYDDFVELVRDVLRFREYIDNVVCVYGSEKYVIYDWWGWDFDVLDDFEVEVLDKFGELR